VSKEKHLEHLQLGARNAASPLGPSAARLPRALAELQRVHGTGCTRPGPAKQAHVAGKYALSLAPATSPRSYVESTCHDGDDQRIQSEKREENFVGGGAPTLLIFPSRLA
jgi:hypothetical protein